MDVLFPKSSVVNCANSNGISFGQRWIGLLADAKSIDHVSTWRLPKQFLLCVACYLWYYFDIDFSVIHCSSCLVNRIICIYITMPLLRSFISSVFRVASWPCESPKRLSWPANDNFLTYRGEWNNAWQKVFSFSSSCNSIFSNITGDFVPRPGQYII